MVANAMMMFPNAMKRITSICEAALASGEHVEGDWKEKGVEGSLGHAAAHFGGVDMLTGENMRVDAGEDHLGNLACRVLMALELRLSKG